MPDAPAQPAPYSAPSAPAAVQPAAFSAPSAPAAVQPSAFSAPSAPAAVQPAAFSAPSAPAAVQPEEYVAPNGGTATAMEVNGDPAVDTEGVGGRYFPNGTLNGKTVYRKPGAPDFPARIVAATDSTFSPTAIRWRIEVDVSGPSNLGTWVGVFVQSTGTATDISLPSSIPSWTAILGGGVDVSGEIEEILNYPYALPIPPPGHPAPYSPP